MARWRDWPKASRIAHKCYVAAWAVPTRMSLELSGTCDSVRLDGGLEAEVVRRKMTTARAAKDMTVSKQAMRRVDSDAL